MVATCESQVANSVVAYNGDQGLLADAIVGLADTTERKLQQEDEDWLV